MKKICKQRLLTNIEFLGCIDSQVKVRGFRIELGEIESILLQNKKIYEVIVTVREVSQNNQIITYVVIKDDKQITDNELQSWLENYLPQYMIPSYFVRISKYH